MKKRSARRSLTSCCVALLLFTLFLFAAPTVMGRYTSSFGGELRFAACAKTQPTVVCGTWTEAAGEKTLPIRIEGGEDAACLRVYLPASPSPAALLLTVDGREYQATVRTIPAGTAAYRTYGEGSVACFLGTEGEELVFDLASPTGEWNGTLTLTQSEADTADVHVTAHVVKND